MLTSLSSGPSVVRKKSIRATPAQPSAPGSCRTGCALSVSLRAQPQRSWRLPGSSLRQRGSCRSREPPSCPGCRRTFALQQSSSPAAISPKSAVPRPRSRLWATDTPRNSSRRRIGDGPCGSVRSPATRSPWCPTPMTAGARTRWILTGHNQAHSRLKPLPNAPYMCQVVPGQDGKDLLSGIPKTWQSIGGF